MYPVSPGGTEIRPPPPPETAVVPHVASASREPEEPVRYSPDLPVLERFDPSTSSIVAGDWLVMLGPSMSSLSPNAYVWWKDTVDSANLVYQKWLTANPLKRLKLPTTELLGRHVEGQLCRVEQKAVPMLLKSVGKELHEDIVASRVMSAAAIVYKVVCKYQPGGSNERQQLLNFLSSPEAAPNCQTAVKSLRKWRRWMVRAVEVGVSLPDPSLQVRGLDKLQPPNLPASSEFRLQTLRTQSLLDQVPSQDAVHEYAELLLAECEAALLGEAAEKRQKVAKADVLQGAEGSEPKGKGKGEKGTSGEGKKSCKHWMTEQGCKFADKCTFAHTPVPKGSGRCFSCSGTGHMRGECPHKSEAGTGGKRQGWKDCWERAS